MAVAFPRFPWLLWGGGKDHEPAAPPTPSLSSSPDFGLGLWENDSIKFPSVKGPEMRSSPRRSRRKWHSREERRIDREYDIVLVPSDGGCISGSDSDDSDWSIGWMESDFLTGSETEDSFAVLVPCYGRGRLESPKHHILGAANSDGYSSDGKKYMEQWLSSLPNIGDI